MSSKALILLHRHGHRAPAKNIMKNKKFIMNTSMEAMEKELWYKHCGTNATIADFPSIPIVQHYQPISDHKPPYHHFNVKESNLNNMCKMKNTHDHISSVNEDVLSDKKTHPFGSLTFMGVKGLFECAQDLVYNFPILKEYSQIDPITKRVNTSIVSTNYNRTQV